LFGEFGEVLGGREGEDERRVDVLGIERMKHENGILVVNEGEVGYKAQEYDNNNNNNNNKKELKKGIKKRNKKKK
jgi:hypothetical protein